MNILDIIHVLTLEAKNFTTKITEELTEVQKSNLCDLLIEKLNEIKK